MDWFDVAKDKDHQKALMNVIMNRRACIKTIELSDSTEIRKFLSTCATDDFSKEVLAPVNQLISQ